MIGYWLEGENRLSKSEAYFAFGLIAHEIQMTFIKMRIILRFLMFFICFHSASSVFMLGS